MKKHNGGYALPLVLVVMAVLCLIATAVLTNARQGLSSQRASIQRMQDKYAAQGAIEQVVAQITFRDGEAHSGFLTDLESLCAGVYGTDAEEDPHIIVRPNDEGEKLQITVGDEETDGSYAFTLESRYGSVQIACKLVIYGAVEEVIQNNGTILCLITPREMVYAEYAIEGVAG